MNPTLITVRDARLTLWREGGEQQRVLGNAQEGLHFDLQRGQHTAIFGPNGAGKSTFLRLLRGEAWLEPQGGSIHWYTEQGAEDAPLAGRALASMVSAAQQDLYVRQGWDISGEDLLATGFTDSPLLYTAPETKQRQAVREIAEKLCITGLLRRPVPALSQGQLRILLLGRALVRRPAVLLLDEYTDGLDAPTRVRMLEVLEKAAPYSTIVLSSHRVDTIPAWIARRLYLEGGVFHQQVPACYAARPMGPEGGTALPAGEVKAPGTEESGADLPPLVELNNATIYIERQQVLRGITWVWRRGEHWNIYGGNGAGKSTLLRLLAGDEYPALGGSIARHLPRHGGAVTDLERIRRGVRLVSDQQQACYGYDLNGLELVLTGFDNSVGLYRFASEKEEEEALRWMQLLRVRPLARRRISSLSTGQLRRLLLARALAGTPDILLLDEPCTGLDPHARSEVLDALASLAEEGVHLALVSHHGADCLPVLNRQARMEGGQLFC